MIKYNIVMIDPPDANGARRKWRLISTESYNEALLTYDHLCAIRPTDYDYELRKIDTQTGKYEMLDTTLDEETEEEDEA